MSDVPSSARAVVIGGGVIGCSVAYHLAKLGWRDVLLLERKQLTCGTTWHAAGLIGELRASHNLTRLAKYSRQLYFDLEAETGVATGMRRNGSVSLALGRERWEELRRNASMAKVFGVEIAEIGPSEVAALYPHVRVDDVVGALHMPNDGQADPANIAFALAKGARQLGATLIEGVKVTGVRREGRRVRGVEFASDTGEHGRIDCEVVVNCAGMWGREVGALAGVDVALAACEHFYVVTEPIEGLGALPVLRVPDECAYYKEDAGKLLVGGFEPVAKPWGLDGIPEQFCFDQLPPDLEHFEPILAAAVERVPLLASAGIRLHFNGPESFTPDDRYLLGEAPDLDGYFLATGFNSIGIQSAGGAGLALAHWIEHGAPPFDLWDVDARRMQPFQSGKRYLAARVTETLGLLYADHFPYRQFESARGVRRSPLHDRLAAAGACFGETAGWERANWFLPQGAQEAPARYAYSWRRQNWFEHARAEHLAIREGVALLDMSSFGKIALRGRDSEAVLQRVCANDVAVEPGRIVYTQWLNENGGIEADVTVARLAVDEFLIVTSAATLRRDRHWLERHIPDGAHAIAFDATSAEAVLMLMGPRARDVLREVTSADVSAAAFPFGTWQSIDLHMALGRAHRVSYVGELGYELYVPSEMAVHVYDALIEAGAAHGLRHAGLHVLDSCRIEKAFRHFGHDISPEDHVLEAGLGFAVATDKPRSRYGDFIGRDAVLAKRQTGLARRLVQLQLTDPAPLLYHNEPVYRDGELVGRITSGAYGHYLGGAIGLAYVPCEPGASARSLLAGS